MNNLKDLRSLLGRCTVRISLTNKTNERGTGFFVAPGTILTCAHVIENAHTNKAPLLVSWEGQTFTASIEQFSDKAYPDLALLKIDHSLQHPCVYLHEDAQTDDKLYSFGYTDNYPDGDPATFVCEGFTSGAQPLIRFKFGEVRAGLSGGPLLNERTGSVCGVVKRTRGSDTIMGGRAIPTGIVYREIPDLAIRQQQFHRQDKRWYDAMTVEQRKESGIKDILSLKDTSGAVEVFYSYIQEDEQLAEKLRRHLVLLKRQELITDWYAGKVIPGQEPSEQIREHLDSASIILLLISSDYLFSEYHDSIEVKRAMERSKAGEAIVIPVLLSPTDDLSGTPFGKLLIIPRNRKPVSKWSDKDEAFANIAREIRAVVEKLRLPGPR
ncbi:MAG TPA: trypsin-like peptidase domain-containing protein [Ktedonobacteraceae bacterium]|nr:trypsin-like peptidase domain-containing protein [Ktedonobacteraceae bacterium]